MRSSRPICDQSVGGSIAERGAADADQAAVVDKDPRHDLHGTLQTVGRAERSTSRMRSSAGITNGVRWSSREIGAVSRHPRREFAIFLPDPVEHVPDFAGGGDIGFKDRPPRQPSVAGQDEKIAGLGKKLQPLGCRSVPVSS